MALTFALCLVLSLACAGCKRGNPAESSASGDLSATEGEGTAAPAAPSAAPGKTDKAENAEKADKKDENAEDAESPSDGTLTDAEFSDFIADGGGRLDVSLQPETTARPGQTTTSTRTPSASGNGGTTTTTTQKTSTPITTTTKNRNEAVWDKDGDGFYDIEVH